MNRWILRGLVTAGFAAGAWLLGSANAYADDTTAIIDVQIGAPVAATGSVVATITQPKAAQPAATAKVGASARVGSAVRVSACLTAGLGTAAPAGCGGSSAARPDVAGTATVDAAGTGAAAGL